MLTAASPAQAETLSGTVSGQKAGETEPLAKVTVSVFDPSTGTEVGSTSTGAGGDYSIDLPSGVFDVRFKPDSESPFDATTAHEVDTSKPRTLNVVLIPFGQVKLTGRLLTATGTAIPGAKVTLNGAGTTTTDAEGAYSFSATPATRQLNASSAGAAPVAGLPQSWFVETAGFVLDSDQVRDFVLPPTSTLTVEALGDKDAPIPGATVDLPLLRNATGMKELGLAEVEADGKGATDSQGRTSFILFTGGATSSLGSVIPPAGSGYGNANFKVPIVNQDTTVVVHLLGFVKLTGRLLTASGTPVPGAKITLNGFGTMNTDAEGSYSFSATPGTRQLNASSAGAAPVAGLPQSWFVETAGFVLDSDQVRDFVLPPTSTLTVEALGDKDAPIPGATVDLPLLRNATGMKELGLTEVEADGKGATDAQGRTSFILFTGGATSSLGSVIPPAGSSYGNANFKIPTLSQDATVVVRPPSFVKLSGRLLTAAGEPVPGAKVGLGGSGAGGTTTTDAKGFYSFSAATGTRVLGASGAALLPDLPQSWNVEGANFALDSDQVRDIVLPPTSVLTVEALGDKDAPIPGATVDFPLFRGATGMKELGLIEAEADGKGATDSQGRVSFNLFTGSRPEGSPPSNFGRVLPPSGSGYGEARFEIPTLNQDTTVVMRFQGGKEIVPPALEIEAQPNGQNGWFVEPPAVVVARATDFHIVTLTCEANGKGIEIEPIPSPGALELEFTLAEEGRHKVTCGANDASGNTAQETIAVLIDATSPLPPMLSADREPEYTGAGGWYRDEVTVSFSAAGDPDLTDETPGSGVDLAGVPSSVTFSASGAHEASGSVTDVAGNVSDEAALTVNVDATLPSSAYSCPASVALGVAASATWEDGDAESGLQGPATGSQKLDTSSVGTHVSTHVATDLVGHSTTSSCQYDVAYAFAIEGKTKLPPAFNKRESKKQLSIKFSLGGNQGLDVFRPGFPALQPIDCKDGEPIGASFPATATDPLSYNAKKAQYEYSWDLHPLGKKGCVALLLGFNDGTTPEIWLTL